MDEPELTVTEAAAIKGVSRSAITRAIRAGRIAARIQMLPNSARGIWRVDRGSLSAWEPATPQEKGRRGGAAKQRNREE